MASSNDIIGAPAVLDTNPDPDEWGVVARIAGIIGAAPYLQQRYDVFVSNANEIYVGYAKRGFATSDPNWTIRKITFASGNPTISQWSDTTAVWDNRLVTVYS